MSRLPDSFFSRGARERITAQRHAEMIQTADGQLREFIASGGGGLSSYFSSGQTVNEVTAMGVAAFYAAANRINDAISGLDFTVERKDGTEVRTPPGWAKDRPLPNWSRWDLLHPLSHSSTVRGFMAAAVKMYHPRTGLPDVLRPLPSRFTYFAGSVGSQARVVYSPSGYRGHKAQTFTEWAGPGDRGPDRCVVWRYHDDGTLSGASVITRAAEVIARAMAVGRHATLYFEYPAAKYLVNISTATSDQVDAFADELAMAQALDRNRHRPVVTNVKDADLKMLRLGDPARDANLVQVIDLMVREIARLFGITPQLLGENNTTWGTGVKQMTRGFIDYVLTPRINFMEKSFGLLLPEGQKAAFDLSRLERPSPEENALIIERLAKTKKFTDNELRRMYDPKLPAVDGGDELQPPMLPPATMPPQQPEQSEEAA